MKIIVAIKQVPVRDSQLRVEANGRWIQEADLSFEINEPDAYALEEALQLKEKHGGEVIALCAGPARAAQTIREALAKGADRAIHIEEENLNTLDTLGVAKLLAGAVKAENPDLILVASGGSKQQTSYSAWGAGPRFGGMGTITPQQSTEGTLIVNLYDAKARQLVWRGIAQGTLSNNGNKNQNLVHKAIEKMFKQYPKT